ncbi:hypothetical protein CDL15_Pgr021888 [Punica granatum]|uniref:Uncharacterized protein n=1 Tax=Punica granatum TaxID=22663 RepID=A0A218WSW0_PUNGR|nr:hypothetical protein CDL15_Pgr021888 [Punica granatum]
MVKDSAWKCSQCGGNGHNSRTCNSKSAGCSTIKLFGVTIAETSHAPMKKSFSMDNLISSSNLDTTTTHHFDVDEAGYLSDGPIHSSKRAKSSHARKRGKPWTEEEHRTFLAGLKKLGKGNWRAISKKFVTTKTPTQVASHAQKYFLRQTSQDKKKRRSSLFDMRFEEPRPAPQDLLCISPSDEKPEIASKPQDIPSPSPSALHPKVSTPAMSTKAQVMDKFPALCLDPQPLLPVAAPSGISFMMGIPGTLQGFPAARVYPSTAYFPVTSFPGECTNRIPKVHGNFGTCSQLLLAHPSGIPSPRSNPSTVASQRVARVSSLTEKDDIGLKLGQPRDPEKDQLSSPTQAGTIRVN